LSFTILFERCFAKVSGHNPETFFLPKCELTTMFRTGNDAENGDRLGKLAASLWFKLRWVMERQGNDAARIATRLA